MVEHRGIFIPGVVGNYLPPPAKGRPLSPTFWLGDLAPLK